ncbi:protein of unknown function [Nonomuraea jiangxiensis]|uniref:DUF1996 domain-containing protein n=2 Tax=Nonomuraea jiangxiensis TaxID=633440 RepID=A0A1G8EZ91_9ACTN|nr:protein of unknown function [Nonomuraea jiangxiensis]
MAAAMSALAMAAGGLVSAAVIGVGPVSADICDPAQAGASPTGQQQNNQQRNNRRNNGQQDDQQGQDQNQEDQGQDQQAPEQQVPEQENAGQDGTGQNGADQGVADQGVADQGGTDQDGADQQAPQGGGVAVRDPAQSPEDGQADEAGQADESASTFSRRGRPTRSATPSPSQTQTQAPDDDPTADPSANPSANPSPSASPTGSPSPSPSPTASGNPECADIGPSAADFVDIRRVGSRQLDARAGRNGSRGTFVAQCGTNRNGHHNPDNFIVAPGVSNGAHHLHDYVGNLSTDAFSTDESLAAADTTCRQGDKSTYFWPVLRNRKVDANANDPDNNIGQILVPRAVTLQFRGNATSRVVAMPRFIRIITGDAKAGTNGGANARAGWSCTGFQNRISPDKYTLCPRGSQVLRILDFPSCWDGQNTDSANHRTHVVFPDQSGACPQGTRAIPQLRMTLAYTVPQGPSYAVDAFPEQKHNPITDHGDFANVMPDRLMRTVVDCINRGRRC